MEMTAVYEMMLINMGTGYTGCVYAFKASDIVYEEGMQSGVCLFFDADMELRSVVSSYSDILSDSIIHLEAIHDYYCMIYDEVEPMSEEEVDMVRNGLRTGLLNLVLLSESTDIPIVSTNN
jgi:hypothetical protein